MTTADVRAAFRELHRSGTIVLPNPWDVGSAKLFAAAGFPALATTSSGFAASLGRHDHRVSADELVAHVAAICAAVDVPVTVDSERCFDDVADTVNRLAEAGAAGVSIEDWDPVANRADPLEVSVARLRTALEAAEPHGVLVTARCDQAIHGVTDFDDTLARLTAYRDAGAGCLFAPGVVDAEQIAAIVALGLPVNVLNIPGVPTIAELTALDVRRVSTGGGLAFAAYGAALRAADELRTLGTSTYRAGSLPADARRAFDA